MKLSIVGCGLLGSMFVHPLASMSVALVAGTSVALFDHDLVEARNAPANLFVPNDVGAKKVDVVARVIEGYGIIPVKAAGVRITKGNTWMLKESDLIIGALDSVTSRETLYQAANEHSIPYLDMGLNELSGRVAWTAGGFSDMQLGEGAKAIQESGDADKKPACHLIGTRVMSGLVTECAALSLFIFTMAHDPRSIVSELLGRVAEKGDMISWLIASGGGMIQARPIFVGNAGAKEAKENGG